MVPWALSRELAEQRISELHAQAAHHRLVVAFKRQRRADRKAARARARQSTGAGADMRTPREAPLAAHEPDAEQVAGTR